MKTLMHILLFCFVFPFCMAQEKNDTTAYEKRMTKNVEAIKTDLKMLQEQLLKGDDSKEYIGRVINAKAATVYKSVSKDSLNKVRKNLKNEYITVEQYKTNGFEVRKIDSVIIKISEGLIEYMKVRMEDGSYFINTKAPIQILTMEKRFDDLLFNPQTNDFIILKDAIIFDANQRFNYLPGDDLIY